MSLPLWLLIDGYNVVAPIAAPMASTGGQPDSRWLQLQRDRLVDLLAKHLGGELCRRTCVVFDAKSPPPGVADRFERHGIRIRFAVGYPEADDLIERIIAKHHSPKQLMVVSSDIRLQTAAARRRSRFAGSQEWLDQLVDGNIRLAVSKSKIRSARNADSISQAAIDEKPNFETDLDQWSEMMQDVPTESDGTAEQLPEDREVADVETADTDDVEQWMRHFGF